MVKYPVRVRAKLGASEAILNREGGGGYNRRDERYYPTVLWTVEGGNGRVFEPNASLNNVMATNELERTPCELLEVLEWWTSEDPMKAATRGFLADMTRSPLWCPAFEQIARQRLAKRASEANREGCDMVEFAHYNYEDPGTRNFVRTRQIPALEAAYKFWSTMAALERLTGDRRSAKASRKHAWQQRLFQRRYQALLTEAELQPTP